MSSLKTTNILHPSSSSNNIVLASDGSVAVSGNNLPTSGPLSGARNRIINGDMRIDQRNAGAAVTINTGANYTYTVDRWAGLGKVSAGVFTVARSTTAPDNFTNSALITVTTAATPGVSDEYGFRQAIEGFNFADIGWGTSAAKAVTMSFWVRSSLTGTFGGAVFSGSSNDSYPFTYSISSANTWEQKTVTIPARTSGTFSTDNSIAVNVWFTIGGGTTASATANAWNTSGKVIATGSTNIIATNGATFYITGVQLEAGSVATPFERRSYGQELALCQRYYYKIATQSIYGIRYSGYSPFFNTPFPVTMRAAPTVTPTLVSTIFTSAGTISALPIVATTADSVSIQVNTSNTSVDYGITYNYTASIEL